MVLVIDGTVGCGKSTLGKLLEHRLGIKLCEELSNTDTTELLDRFYRDQERWSFALQIHFLNERFRMIKDIHKAGKGLLDRSIFGDRIFAEMLNEDGMMLDEEYRTYSTLLDSMLEHVKPPSVMVYLECSTETAIKRINKRNRGEECNVPHEYWERLNTKYDKWFEEYDLSPKICINVDNLDLMVESEREIILKRIENKLKELKYIK
jgi:deoxyadenosine/deoxycytidine kinase